MANTVGRLDLLIYGMLERISARDPVASALFQTFAPEIQNLLKPLDIKPLRQAVRAQAGEVRKQQRRAAVGSGQQKPARAAMAKTPGIGKRKDVSETRVTVTGPDGKAETVRAEWLS